MVLLLKEEKEGEKEKRKRKGRGRRKEVRKGEEWGQKRSKGGEEVPNLH